MKHIKKYEITEALVSNDKFAKYKKYLMEKFSPWNVSIYVDLLIELEFSNISKDVILELCDYFKDLDFKIEHRTEIDFRIENVPQSFYEKMDRDIEAKKYNL